MGRRSRHILGVATSGQQCTDLVTNRQPAHTVTDCRDFTRGFQPRQITGCRGRGIQTGALQRVGPIDPRISNLDHHLPMLWLRHRPLDKLEHLGPSGFGDLDGAHSLCHDVKFLRLGVGLILFFHSIGLASASYNPN